MKLPLKLRRANKCLDGHSIFYLLHSFQNNRVMVEEIGVYVQLASKLYEYFSHAVSWAPFL